MHVHSTASELSKLGIQRSLHLPECATPPEEVYELAKRRGMGFVTITDHDTIEGALALDSLPDTFISEELTVWFKGEPQAVHVLCYGITPDDHEWLQAHNDDVEACAGYLHDSSVTTALAHPFYAVEAPLTARHRRRLAQLFPIWETRNGARAKELNLPAFVYIETHGGTAIGGSDDHAGIDIGRTFTETPLASTPADFLAHIRAGRAAAHGAQGSAAKWTHAAMALAIRSLGRGDGASRPDPAAVLKLVERVMREGDVRHGPVGGDLGPDDALALLRAWLEAMDLDVDDRTLLTKLQDGELSHPDLLRRARRIHERKLADAVHGAVEMIAGEHELNLQQAAARVFDACVPTIPYAAAGAFLGREKLKLARNDGGRPRVALVADGLGSIHGVTRTIQQIRDRGVPGFDVEVIGTDADVDRRLSAVAEIEVPFYPGLRSGYRASRRSSTRSPKGAMTSSTSAPRGRPASAPGCWPGCWSSRCSAATTPSWPPTPVGAAGRPSSRAWPRSRSARSTGAAGSCSRPARPATNVFTGSASTPSASAAGIAASTSHGCIRGFEYPGCCPVRSTSSTAGG